MSGPCRRSVAIIVLCLAALLTVLPADGSAANGTASGAAPHVSITFDETESPGRVAVVLEIFLLLTVLSLAPGILVMTTAFTRIVIVLSVLRQAMGTQQMPPNPVVVGLALFLTFFIMEPVFQDVHRQAFQPYMAGEMTLKQAAEAAGGPLRTFMARQTREKDIALFVEISRSERPKTIQDVPMTVLVPAFIISELKTAFQIGFLLYMPFLIIDMVVASVLLSMGMMMLPPVMVSLPFKIILFVLSDGWHLITGSLVKSFG